MTAKEYLTQAFMLDRRIRIELEKVRAMRASLDYKSPALQGFGSGSPEGRDMQIARVLDHEAGARRLIGELVCRKLEIGLTLDRVSDLRLREILVRRYLSFQKWEQISVDMTIDLRWLYRLHKKGLAEVERILTIESH